MQAVSENLAEKLNITPLSAKAVNLIHEKDKEYYSFRKCMYDLKSNYCDFYEELVFEPIPVPKKSKKVIIDFKYLWNVKPYVYSETKKCFECHDDLIYLDLVEDHIIKINTGIVFNVPKNMVLVFWSDKYMKPVFVDSNDKGPLVFFFHRSVAEKIKCSLFTVDRSKYVRSGIVEAPVGKDKSNENRSIWNFPINSKDEYENITSDAEDFWIIPRKNESYVLYMLRNKKSVYPEEWFDSLTTKSLAVVIPKFKIENFEFQNNETLEFRYKDDEHPGLNGNYAHIFRYKFVCKNVARYESIMRRINRIDTIFDKFTFPEHSSEIKDAFRFKVLYKITNLSKVNQSIIDEFILLENFEDVTCEQFLSKHFETGEDLIEQKKKVEMKLSNFVQDFSSKRKFSDSDPDPDVCNKKIKN